MLGITDAEAVMVQASLSATEITMFFNVMTQKLCESFGTFNDLSYICNVNAEKGDERA